MTRWSSIEQDQVCHQDLRVQHSSYWTPIVHVLYPEQLSKQSESSLLKPSTITSWVVHSGSVTRKLGSGGGDLEGKEGGELEEEGGGEGEAGVWWRWLWRQRRMGLASEFELKYKGMKSKVWIIAKEVHDDFDDCLGHLRTCQTQTAETRDFVRKCSLFGSSRGNWDVFFYKEISKYILVWNDNSASIVYWARWEERSTLSLAPTHSAWPPQFSGKMTNCKKTTVDV